MPTPKTEKFERRVFVAGGLEIRATDTKRTLAGHAAVFNQATDLGYFEEMVAPGAFAKSIGADDIRALFNHDPNFVLGRNKANTLRLSEDSQGLAFEIDVPDTAFARDLVTSIDRKDITQCSFGFEVIAQEWRKKDDGRYTRTLREVKLWDVSPVTYPAYAQTDVAARSLDDFKRELEGRAPPLALYMRRQQLLEATIG
jgi:HK97 family phage prohead protease